MDEETTGLITRPEETGAAGPAEALVEDLLVEEVSIDGMCGVY